MTNMSKFIIALAFLSIFMIEPAFATGSMRCGTHIVNAGGRQGMSMYEVLKKCGEPTERFGNTWIYDRSGGSKRTLRFNSEGTLSRID
ncbi:MAG: DUF2845 domain-containing protein [Gammaproteobacteria bacterium]